MIASLVELKTQLLFIFVFWINRSHLSGKILVSTNLKHDYLLFSKIFYFNPMGKWNPI